MEINRNQWFLFGLIILLLGAQFRLVDSYVLTAESTELLARGTGQPVAAANPSSPLLLPLQSAPATVRKTVVPPEWIGWVMLSVGLVATFQSLAMRRPD
jgi:hypothetical protein